MSEAPQDQITCPYCGTRHHWQPELAERKLTCHCGQELRLPAEATGEVELIGPPPEFEDDGTYSLALPEDEASDQPAVTGAGHPPATSTARPTAADNARCPSCNQSLKRGAVICINCGFNLEAGEKIQTQVAAAEPTASTEPIEPVEPAERVNRTPIQSSGSIAHPPAKPSTRQSARPDSVATSPIAQALDQREDEAASPFTDVYVPLIFIACGLALIQVIALVAADTWLGALAISASMIAVHIFFTVPLLIALVFAAAKLFDISFGPFGLAMLKLTGIAIGPGTVADGLFLMAAPVVPMGWLGTILLLFILYVLFLGVPMGKMFGLDLRDVGQTVWVIIAVKLISGLFLLIWVFGSFA